MGHFLSTVNPEAVDQIGTEAAQGPGVGSMVVYIPRPGEGRGRRHEFPALVMGENEDGTLDLLIVYDANDVTMRERIPLADPDHPFPAWTHVRDAAPEQFEPSRLNKIRQDLDKLQHDVFSDYTEPKGGLISLMVDFEKQLRAVRERIATLEAPTGPKKVARGK